MAPLYTSALVKLVAVFGLAVALAVAGATTASLLAGRQEALEASRANTGSMARALTDAVARSFNSIDVTLAAIADLAREGRLNGDRADLGPAAAQRLRLAPHVRQILLVDLTGSILFDSAGGRPGRVINVEAMLEELSRLPRSLVIGQPQSGRFIGGETKAAGQMLIPVAGPVRGANGDIKALVLAAVNPEHFHALFHEIELETRSRVQMWRFDGVLLAGDVLGTGRAPGRDLAQALPLFARHLKTAELGSYTEFDDDGIKRITSYRTTLAWPVVVNVGIPVDVALEQWRKNARSIGLPVSVVLVAVICLTVLLVRALARRARDEARLRLSDRVLANVSNGVTIAEATSGDLPLIYVNEAFERITGYSAPQVLGRNARFLHAADPAQDPLDEVRTSLAEGRSVTVKLRNFRADGTPFWNRLSLAPVRNDSGVIAHWVGVQSDITQEEEASAALAAAYDELARYSADMERFSFVLAHHLQEPARQMRVQAQMMLHRLGEQGEQAREQAGLIIEASARLVELLRDVQSYLAIERQASSGEVRSSVTLAVDQAVAKVMADYPDVVFRLDRGDLPEVAVSPKRLEELFRILIENAVEFRHADRKPEIAITAEGAGKFWRFQVSDNGIGIEPAYFDRIFIPLERLHLRGAEHRGTGIGLAVARRIVEAARGSISVESDGASGSTFTLTLPRA